MSNVWYYILVDDGVAGRVESKEQALKLGRILSKKKTADGETRTLKVVDSDGELIEIFDKN